MTHPAARLPPFDPDSGALHVVIETTKGSRNKFTFDPGKALFALSGVLPAGASFPFDFGFVPGTVSEDGDPLDVLLLMDEPAFVGCLVHSRLVGVITALQTERDGETMRNDRLIAVAEKSHAHEDIRSLDDLADALLHELEHFFVSYNEANGKHFAVTGRKGPRAAASLVRAGEARAHEAGKPKRPKRPATRRSS